MNPLQHLIHDSLEQRDSFPVPARDVYMVMGKLKDQWKTIITKTDDLNHARRTMYAAQMHGSFSRIVLCKSREIQGINSLRWKTLECALPMRAQIIPPSMDMQQILEKMKQNPANRNHFGSFGKRVEAIHPPQKQAVPIVKERQIANFPLSIAIIGAVLSMQILPFVAAALLVISDWAYIEEKIDDFLDVKAFSFFARYRQIIYLIIALAVLIPAMVMSFTQTPLF